MCDTHKTRTAIRASPLFSIAQAVGRLNPSKSFAPQPNESSYSGRKQSPTSQSSRNNTTQRLSETGVSHVLFSFFVSDACSLRAHEASQLTKPAALGPALQAHSTLSSSICTKFLFYNLVFQKRVNYSYGL